MDVNDPKNAEKPLARCTECDREVEHYNTWLLPTGEESVVCWRCRERDEKGFFAKATFKRDSRRGVIPR